MNRLIHSVVLQVSVLFTLSACSEKPPSPATQGDATMNADAPSEEIVGVASAALTQTDLTEYSKAALEGDGQKAFLLMMHYQMAELDHRNAEYWAQISAENGNLDGIASYVSYLLHVPAGDRCRRAQFWVKRAREIAGSVEDSSVKAIEQSLAEKCSSLL